MTDSLCMIATLSSTYTAGMTSLNLVKYALMIKFIEQRLNCKECRSFCLDTVCFRIFTPYSAMSEKKERSSTSRAQGILDFKSKIPCGLEI